MPLKVINIDLKDKSYDIYIERGILDNIGKNIKKIWEGSKIGIITDHNLDSFYSERIKKSLQDEGFSVKVISIRPGEKSKSLSSLEAVYKELAGFNMTRKDLIIAFGGGVVGDLGGFAASTYLRGIPCIQVPTSLLSQIDSSIGGKAAVNLDMGKNLVGSFYQPKAVYIDPDVLSTLDEIHLKDGLAEVIKYAAILDEELFDRLIEYGSMDELLGDIEYIIFRCCSIKKALVEKDEFDFGERMLLNFGHTIGHGIEKYFNYEKYSHGFGVSIGMYNITKKSEEMGETQKGTSLRLKNLLLKYGLPCDMPDMDSVEFMKIILSDKKNMGGFLNLVLLKRIGQAFVKPVEIDEAKKYILEGCN